MGNYTGPLRESERSEYWRDVYDHTRYPIVKDAAGAMILSGYNVKDAQAFLSEIGAEVAARHLNQYLTAE